MQQRQKGACIESAMQSEQFTDGVPVSYNDVMFDVIRYGSLQKAITVVAYVLRFANNVRNRSTKTDW